MLIPRSIFLICCPLVLCGANIPVTLVGATETQLEISYNATSSDACTIAVSDLNGGPAVADLDPTKFTGANSDLNRTWANGYRWPAIVSGSRRTVFIGGHDEVKQAIDGKWYSTALQVNTVHNVTVTCNGGVDTGTITAQTANLPQGSSYPELPIPAPVNPNPGYPAPTINWSDRRVSYTDPITGVLLKRVTSEMDLVASSSTGNLYSFAYDLNNSWTNPTNALTNQQSATLAVTSTPNAPLFLAHGYPPPSTDEQIALYGKGDSGSEIAEVCWSQDSGNTCATSSFDCTFSTTTGPQCSLPGGYPSNRFDSWGLWTQRNGQYDIGNTGYTGVNASGSVVSMGSINGVGFNIDRAANAQATLTNCAAGSNIQLTVSHVDTPEQITVVQTGLNHTNCTYQEFSSGIRIILKNSGTLRLSATYNSMVGMPAIGTSSGHADVCNPNMVTDISTDCDGVAHNPPLTGRLCQVQMGGGPNQGIYLVQDNGRVCLQSIGKHGTIQHLYALDNPWLTAKSWLGNGLTLGLYSVTKTDTNYTEYVPGPNPPDDGWTYANIATSALPLDTQIINAGGNGSSDIRTGLWGASNVNGIIGGYIQAAYQPGGQDHACIRAVTDGNFNLVKVYDSWKTYPMRWGGCHSGPFGTGPYQNLNLNPLNNFSGAFGGPYLSPLTSIRKNGVFQTWTLTVSSGTAGNPTTLVSPNHDLGTWGGKVGAAGGNYVTCSGGTGSWAAVNGTFQATVLDNNSFTLPVSTSGTVTGSILCNTAPPAIAVQLSSISGNTATINNCTDGSCGYYGVYIPDGRVLFKDSDPIAVDAYPTMQFYAKVTGMPSTQFGVYTDSSLSTPADAAHGFTFSPGNHVMLAEACPSQPAASFMPNGTLYFDSGSLSNGTPLIRCLTLKLASQPCYHNASAGEASAYPCPTNPSWSSLENLAPGDVLYDEVGADQPTHEHLLVLSVTQNSPTDINVTVMRRYGNDPSWNADGGPVYCCAVHGPGWLPFAFYTMQTTWFDASNSSPNTTPESPLYSTLHHDLGPAGPGLVSLAAPPVAPFDDIPGASFSQYLSTAITSTHNNLAVWASDTADTLYGNTYQSYPSHRQGTARASEQIWKGDVTAINGPVGNNAGIVESAGPGRTVTKVSGFNYVYKITNPAPSGTANVKLVPYLMSMGIQYFQDISGPGSQLTDSTPGKWCEAFAANECVPGSTPGSFYFSSNIYYDTGGSCYTNNQTLFAPCLYPLWPMAGWIEQLRQTPVDQTGSGVRRLTMGWSLPLQHFSFYNWIASPDAQWGFFAANPVNQKTIRNNTGSEEFMMKLPPWPAFRDKVARSTFVSVPVRLPAKTGETIRIAFGYGENGNPGNLYCTTRQETCWTSTTATPSNPFVFAGESQQKATCDSGCSIPIPAIPGRVLFYQVEHTNGFGTITEPLRAVAVP